jgi:uncharacterized integral membrane protein
MDWLLAIAALALALPGAVVALFDVIERMAKLRRRRIKQRSLVASRPRRTVL